MPDRPNPFPLPPRRRWRLIFIEPLGEPVPDQGDALSAPGPIDEHAPDDPREER